MGVAGRVQPTDERQLHEADPTRRDRGGRQQSREREHGEHLRPADLLLGDPHVAERQEEDQPQREVADECGDRERDPALRHQDDGLLAKANRCLAPSRDGDLPDQPLKRHEILTRHRTLEVRVQDGRGRPHDLELFVLRRMLDDDVEHEAVELGFRQGIRAFELDRVLRREDEERLVERVGAALNRDAVLLHRFEERRLGFRRRAIDFVGQHDVREDRARREDHLTAAGARLFLDDVGAGDVGRHQVGRELNPVELELEHLRERRNEQRLRQPGHADDQAVAADEQRRQHELDDLALSDDPLLQL